jgi:hypothetical protein
VIGEPRPPHPPGIVSRRDWGASESVRFDARGAEITPPTFWSVQKLIVHHTAGANEPPDPAATVREIQRFHAVDRGFGDIAYNLLIDAQGRVYEGRFSPFAAAGDSPAGHDPQGRAVAATHTLGYNAGTISVALLGHFVQHDPPQPAVESLVEVVAWLAAAHGLDPLGEGIYRNPLSGEETPCPNVAGHRDLAPTLCPGERLAAALPEVRARAAQLIESARASLA